MAIFPTYKIDHLITGTGKKRDKGRFVQRQAAAYVVKHHILVKAFPKKKFKILETKTLYQITSTKKQSKATVSSYIGVYGLINHHDIHRTLLL